jgi:hypothetical protein
LFQTRAVAGQKKPRDAGFLVSSNDTGLSGCAIQILADFSAWPKGPSRNCGTCASVRAANTHGRREMWLAAVCAHPDSLVSSIETVAETLAVRFLPQPLVSQQLAENDSPVSRASP